jgi:hypothetical protein
MKSGVMGGRSKFRYNSCGMLKMVRLFISMSMRLSCTRRVRRGFLMVRKVRISAIRLLQSTLSSPTTAQGSMVKHTPWNPIIDLPPMILVGQLSGDHLVECHVCNVQSQLKVKSVEEEVEVTEVEADNYMCPYQ